MAGMRSKRLVQKNIRKREREGERERLEEQEPPPYPEAWLTLYSFSSGFGVTCPRRCLSGTNVWPNRRA